MVTPKTAQTDIVKPFVRLNIINAKKTGMGDVPTAAIATSVEYGIIFSGNKSTLMRLIRGDARCEQYKIGCSQHFF